MRKGKDLFLTDVAALTWDRFFKASKVKLTMQRGHLDPWYKRYRFGLRQLIILGRELPMPPPREQVPGHRERGRAELGMAAIFQSVQLPKPGYSSESFASTNCS